MPGAVAEGRQLLRGDGERDHHRRRRPGQVPAQRPVGGDLARTPQDLQARNQVDHGLPLQESSFYALWVHWVDLEAGNYPMGHPVVDDQVYQHRDLDLNECVQKHREVSVTTCNECQLKNRYNTLK